MSRIKKKAEIGNRRISTGIRMEKKLHEKLKELADEEHRTVSNYIENVLLDHVENIKTKK